jgi:hypothetical protein
MFALSAAGFRSASILTLRWTRCELLTPPYAENYGNRLEALRRTTHRSVSGQTEAKPTVAERRLLELLLADENLRRTVVPHLELDDYADLPTASIFAAIVEGEREGTTIDFDFLSKRTEGSPMADLLPSLMMGEEDTSADEPAENGQVAALRCINALRLMKVDRQISNLTSEIAAAERNGELERRDQLATEHLELARRRSGLLPQAQAAQAENR